MKKLKYILIVIPLWLIVESLSAQQAPFYSQYMFNDYLVNPAVAGTYNYFQVRVNSRIQWQGITDSPRTMSIAGYGPLKEKDMGYGGYIYYDKTGPESKMFLGGSYAYNIAINDAIRISGGLTIGVIQYSLDGTLMYIDEDIIDPAISNAIENKIIPDASVGFYVYSSQFYAGIAVHQLFGNKYYDHPDIEGSTGDSRLVQNFNVSGGYFLMLNRDFTLSPSALIKFSLPNQFQFDLSAKVTYQRMVWGALSYRYLDAVSIMVGYEYEDKIKLGISYDITTSEIRKYTDVGTIEIMLGYKFNKIK
jgi:type IX secretion system PorP/SprF family membrane protein